MDLTILPPKLCMLHKWPHYNGYGFDLVTNKAGEGHFVSMVHQDGPAEATNVCKGDWLIEVNRQNVEKLSHSQVIKTIKESQGGRVSLLLLPEETEKWRKRYLMVITSSHPDLEHYFTKDKSQNEEPSFFNVISDRVEKFSGKKSANSKEIIANGNNHRHSVSNFNGSPQKNIQKENITQKRFSSRKEYMEHETLYNEKSKLEGSFSESNSLKNSLKSHNSVSTLKSNVTEGSQSSHITTITILDREFFARQCKLRKNEECSDYGFKLDSLPENEGHFLCNIDPDGPAAKAGVEENDRLIEVNNVNVEYTSHQNLVKMIRNSPDQEVTFLVVDKHAYEWFLSRNLRIHHNSTTLIRDMDNYRNHLINERVSARKSHLSLLQSDSFHRSSIGSEMLIYPTVSVTEEGEACLIRELIRMPESAPNPRICTIVSKPDQKFGFTLNTYHKDSAKLISEIEPDSPASLAGLRQWDRLIEVNGINVNRENHAQIKKRIENSSYRVQLMVLQESEYAWYEKNDLIPRSNQTNVVHISNESGLESLVQVSKYVNSLSDPLDSKKTGDGKTINLVNGSRAVSDKPTDGSPRKSRSDSERLSPIKIDPATQDERRWSSYVKKLDIDGENEAKNEHILGNLRKFSAKELRSMLPANKRQAYELCSSLDFEEKIEYFNNL
ncbi:Na(+)/H(+) exchange regulatory cofactor NHE-RF3-like [Brevipalpus obovatus]|uniref:Na(+)/H(+) exchange regulatory cofactor NHE-RF3-like n=1 Tax=Brevipalpus obovatus TaxID=246614 RepID=UPI003D9EB371